MKYLECGDQAGNLEDELLRGLFRDFVEVRRGFEELVLHPKILRSSKQVGKKEV